ncbi:MAG TPA: prolipoprotein diacylglyceryl transferase [Candidatus Limnocylindria bacterium]|nr:prolipoprotein diacylglyceryl transferase [Candidatus Limnocylindria bacterium]
MYPILFQFGPITIYSFGVFMALAALSAVWVLTIEMKRRGYNPELASTMVFAAAIGGLVGARLLFIVGDWENFLRAPMSYILTGAGFTWYGGFFGGAAAASWVVKKNKISWPVGADMAAPALALAYGVGRIGCHVAGDGDWGRVTDVPWGVAYTNAIVGWADPNTGIPYPAGVVVHPTPIYEFLQGVAVFGVLWSLRKKDYAPGTIAWLYLILSGLMRFTVEFWRINTAVVYNLSEAQLFSVLLMVLGLALLLLWPARQRA